MESLDIDGARLFFRENERDSAERIREVCTKSLTLIKEKWALPAPPELRVYVMTSPFGFVFHSAPWFWRPVLALSLPFWGPRVVNFWRYAGGWAQSYGARRAVGVKPARLMRQAESGLGARLFIKEDDVEDKIRNITCHELTHACTAPLRLPSWLNEGLAMVTVDRLLGKPTVKPETIGLLARNADGGPARRVGMISPRNAEDLILMYARGYWTTRYLDESYGELLVSLLGRRRRDDELRNEIADVLQIDHDNFWAGIDRKVAAYFGNT